MMSMMMVMMMIMLMMMKMMLILQLMMRMITMPVTKLRIMMYHDLPQVYVKIMESSLEEGAGAAEKERIRLHKILADKVKNYN